MYNYPNFALSVISALENVHYKQMAAITSKLRAITNLWTGVCLYVVLSCVGRGLCDGLITRSEESYRVSVCV
jgi:hypothetical protein